jgi:hypothetical protein
MVDLLRSRRLATIGLLSCCIEAWDRSDAAGELPPHGLVECAKCSTWIQADEDGVWRMVSDIAGSIG